MKNGVLRGVGLLILAAWLIASPARAAGWTDLTEEHWAYETMARAEALLPTVKDCAYSMLP